MFKRLQSRNDRQPSDDDLTGTKPTPNSRILPPSQGYNTNSYQMSQETRQRLLERHLSNQTRGATSPVDSIPSVEYNSPRYSSPYETYAARESLIDPESASVEYESFEYNKPVDTFIEPNMSRLRDTTVQPMSISMYSDYNYLDPATADVYGYHNPRAPTSPLDKASRGEYFNDSEMVDPHIRTLTPPMPPVIQKNHHHQQAVVHHSYVPVPSPSKAVIDSQQAYLDDNDNQLAPPRPSTASSRHPQPLPPLVIPPSPVRSVSAPDSPWQSASPRSSSLHDSPRQRLPTPNTGNSSPSPHSRYHMHHPIAPSPQPSPSTAGSSPMGANSLPSPFPVLSPSKSTPTGGVDKKKAHSKKKESVVAGGAAEQLVHAGIKYHEAGQLEKAADNFKFAAAQGSPLGMFLYGVSLRHGWGCKKNEKTAFQYLQKAAESAVLDLNNLSSTVNMSAARGELVMAIYELGVSFRHGWGCAKDKASAVYFFKIAADLGDPDAQNDLGHCYYHGQGVKKDLYKAAKYYRKAAKQGHGIMGNSWIFKSKYDPKH
ncbi:hypothetical protein VKS41_002837 [Umbelopsis sp. WA50703]